MVLPFNSPSNISMVFLFFFHNLIATVINPLIHKCQIMRNFHFILMRYMDFVITNIIDFMMRLCLLLNIVPKYLYLSVSFISLQLRKKHTDIWRTVITGRIGVISRVECQPSMMMCECSNDVCHYSVTCWALKCVELICQYQPYKTCYSLHHFWLRFIMAHYNTNTNTNHLLAIKHHTTWLRKAVQTRKRKPKL